MNTSMNVLNYQNRLILNNYIKESRALLLSELPDAVSLSPKTTATVSLSEKNDYIETYVDELDEFGVDLIGKPISEIFGGCVTPEEEKILAENSSVTEDVAKTLADIWNKAYALEMKDNLPDILYDADEFFREKKRELDYYRYAENADPDYDRI